MSFLDGLLKGAGDLMFGDNIGGNILSTVLTGYALKKVTDSMNSDKEDSYSSGQTPEVPKEPDWGVRLQLSADTNTKIPVVYGSAFTAGKLIDTRMTSNNQKMHYALVLSESTGSLLSGGASNTKFKDLYWNNNRIVFKSDGITADYTVDRGGKVDRSIAGLVKIYCYNRGSNSPVVPENYTNNSLQPAYNIMPYWNSSYTANELVFVIVEVSYSRDKGITGLGTLTTHLYNNLTKPGDVLYDLMTNTRYGAGISPGEINQ